VIGGSMSQRKTLGHFLAELDHRRDMFPFVLCVFDGICAPWLGRLAEKAWLSLLKQYRPSTTGGRDCDRSLKDWGNIPEGCRGRQPLRSEHPAEINPTARKIKAVKLTGTPARAGGT
jgi:hypothetical protein